MLLSGGHVDNLVCIRLFPCVNRAMDGVFCNKILVDRYLQWFLYSTRNESMYKEVDGQRRVTGLSRCVAKRK